MAASIPLAWSPADLSPFAAWWAARRLSARSDNDRVLAPRLSGCLRLLGGGSFRFDRASVPVCGDFCSAGRWLNNNFTILVAVQMLHDMWSAYLAFCV
jgi:hypothetical protein